MSNATHTPGPWTIGNHGDGLAISDANGNRLASLAYARNIISMKIPSEETEANARLIAATPELLATLKAIAQRINGEWDAPELLAMGELVPNETDDILAWARAAIAKATGDA